MLRLGLSVCIRSNGGRGVVMNRFTSSPLRLQLQPVRRSCSTLAATAAGEGLTASRAGRWMLRAAGLGAGALVGAAFMVPEPTRVLVGIARFTSCLAVGTWIAADYKWSLRGLEGEAYDRVQQEVHLRCAKRLLKLFQYNKGIFIKFGQHLAAMDYLLPHEYTDTMRVLQDHAPAVSYEDIERVFIEEFGSPPQKLFDEFDKKPIAAASLAQVHVARVGDQKVAVKVQFPGLRETCEGDSMTIAVLIDIAAKLFPEFELKWFIKEVNYNLPLELDFTHEGRNSELVAKSFRKNPNVKLPLIDWSRSTDRVLTMEFCEGVHVDDVEGLKAYGVNFSSLATTMTDIFSKMIFEDGFVHCDPHPGNILVRPRSLGKRDGRWARITAYFRSWLPGHVAPPFEVVLLDHGLYRDLNNGTIRTDYLHLWDALINFDETKIEKYAKRFGAHNHQVFCSIMTAKPWDRLSEAPSMDSRMTKEELEALPASAQKLLREITHTLATVKPDLLLLFKTNDNLRAINRVLGSPINTYLVTAKTVSRLLFKETLKDDNSWGNWITAWRRRAKDQARIKAAETVLSVV